jgi:hypothetical protein
VECALQALEAAALRTIQTFEAHHVANTLQIMARTRYSPWDPSLVPKLEGLAEALRCDDGAGAWGRGDEGA